MSYPCRSACILVSVFLTGMAILIIEIVATRILAPYFGNSIFTFSSVIGIILTALSLGYYLGGRLADRKPYTSFFFGLISVGGVAVLILQLLNETLLPFLAYRLSMIHGPLLTSVLLFLVPALLLGTLSPYAIKLLHVNEPGLGIGRVSGLVFFWSTLGSIAGSLSAGFFLIPRWGVSYIVIGVGYCLLLLGGIGLLLNTSRKKTVAITLLAIIACLSLIINLLSPTRDETIIYQAEGLYEQITVRDSNYNNRPVRLLFQDKNLNSGMYLDDGRMAFDYTKYFDLFRLFVPELNRALAIGGGAYSVPKAILRDHPAAHVDVAEIEPSLLYLSRVYFGLPNDPRLNNYVMDGRRFLFETNETYDLIFMDVYRSFAAVPMQFTTHEFFDLVLNRLNTDGVFIANYFGSLSAKTRSVIFSVYKTMQSVFPQVFLFATINPESDSLQNFIFVGLGKEIRITEDQIAETGFAYPLLKNVAEHELQLDPGLVADVPVFTDDYAPVEYLAANVIRQYEKLMKEK